MEAKNQTHRRQPLVEVINELVLVLNDKEKRVISGRFGLLGKKETLSAIGKELKRSRERIRQIEKNALKKLAKRFTNEEQNQKEKILAVFEKSGGVVVENDLPIELLKLAGGNKLAKNYLILVLTIVKGVAKINGSDDLKNSWRIESLSEEKIIGVCRKMVSYFNREKLAGDIDDIAARVEGFKRYQSNFINACVNISNKLARAKNGLIGLKSWPTINPRNVRDKIYYVLKNSGKPLHFTRIAAEIIAMKFDLKKVVRATIHNELIADKRFVLIGRGIYALREWGYSDGTVYDVIKNLLENSKKPMPIKEIIDLVSKSRRVKINTIVINLQTKREFKRVAGGYVFRKL